MISARTMAPHPALAPVVPYTQPALALSLRTPLRGVLSRAVGALPTQNGGTVTVRFSVPGRYRLFCSLHPVTMHEVVDVTRS